MSQVLTWPATPSGSYAIDVLIAGIAVNVMVDSGLVDPAQKVGFELDPSLFDQIEQTGLLKDISTRSRRDSTGRKSLMAVGLVQASLALPKSNTPVGASVEVYVARSFAGLPNRVGVVFFHKLPGSAVYWNCQTRTWSVSLA